MKQLFGNRVALRVENEDETTESGIVIPGQKDKKKYIGEVVMVGKGLRLQDGNFSGMDIKPGMRVVYEPYAGKNVLRKRYRVSYRKRTRYRYAGIIEWK